ncbi:MAG: hypothetical protein WA194_06655 [Patescibacteria group bacterium]
MESDVAKRYDLDEIWAFVPVYVAVPLNERPEKFGDWSASEKTTSTA